MQTNVELAGRYFVDNMIPGTIFFRQLRKSTMERLTSRANQQGTNKEQRNLFIQEVQLTAGLLIRN